MRQTWNDIPWMSFSCRLNVMTNTTLRNFRLETQNGLLPEHLIQASEVD